jgi:RNA polymerase sigma-70 factor (ECF subfamily)
LWPEARTEQHLNEPVAIPDRPGDEPELARRAASGDRRAFAELYDRHVDLVYRYAFFRVRTAAEAEDVTSEVFHRALVAIPRYEPRRPFLAFLYTIARNVVTDRLRRTRPQASFEDALAHPSEVPGPEERAAASDEVRELRAAIARLTPVQQEVMLMMLEDRSVKEIAKLTGKREGTIRGIHMRALESLRQMLGEARS